MFDFLLWFNLAQAEEPAPSLAGVPIHSVQIVSPGGGVPEESLDPLLRSRQGEPLNPVSVRLDLTTLFHAGEFSAVEAQVDPWVAYDDDGNPRQAVILSYVVVPAPRIGKLDVNGDRPGLIKSAARKQKDDTFYPEVDSAGLEHDLALWYHKRGYPSAKVQVTTTVMDEKRGQVGDRLEVHIHADPGPPRRLKEVKFVGELPVRASRLKRVAARAGLREGRPFAPEVVDDAQFALRRDLAAPDRWFGLQKGGWVKTRVTPVVSGSNEAGYTVQFHVESGPRLALDVDGLWPQPQAKVRAALSIDERTRITKGFLESAPDRMSNWLQRRGYLESEVAVNLDSGEVTETLHVKVKKGPKHHLSPIFGRRWRIDFEGNTALGNSALRTVMVQASEDVLRKGYYTEPELKHSLEAAQQYYRAKGYPEARLALASISKKPRFSLWRIPGLRQWGAAMGILPPVDIRLTISVIEGPQTRMAECTIQGAAANVDLAPSLKAAEQMASSAYSPQTLDALAKEIVRAHRANGYLEADARVITDRTAEGEIRAIIAVEPGPQVLLRSSIIAGNHYSRTPFLRKQLDLVLGAPITEPKLDEIRKSLYDLGIFSNVSTDLLGDGAARDLVISVDERSRWDFEIGGGISTDQGLRGFGRISRGNVWGRAHRWELFGLVGFDYRSDSLTDWGFDIADPEWRAAATYTAPHFPLRSQRLIVDALLREEIQERTWRMARSGLGVALETRLGPTTLRGGARLEARRLIEVDRGGILPGEPWAKLLSSDSLPTPWRDQASVQLFLLHDRRDNPVAPSKGLMFSVLAELDPGLKLFPEGDLDPVTFAKTEVRATGFVPMGPVSARFSGEGSYAHVFGDGVIPLEERFRLGGTGNLRGFRQDAVGPRNEVDPADIGWPDGIGPIIDRMHEDRPTRWVSTGGDARMLATAELLVPFPVLGLPSFDGYSAALFADVGNVWLLSSTAASEFPEYEAIFNPPLRYGVGLGLRVGTPVGPLQIDLGVNPEAAFSRGDRGTLLRDIWEEPAVRGHIALGSTF